MLLSLTASTASSQVVAIDSTRLMIPRLSAIHYLNLNNRVVPSLESHILTLQQSLHAQSELRFSLEQEIRLLDSQLQDMDGYAETLSREADLFRSIADAAKRERDRERRWKKRWRTAAGVGTLLGLLAGAVL